ncbi:MAG: hypothetical protein CBC04_02525 [Verrucomicrobia bacterium TMED44]|nr:MAG: hypothetical protein CBC04_04900 [Verrucomicrobia bacterium TMED44]OUU27759.1 MAG: hypothetical protein CBC04_02525 [Verrucomicrobia bacterium TMED44]
MSIIFRIILFLLVLGAVSCGRQDPEGKYAGEIKDWIYEVFDGSVISNGEEGKIRLILRQTPDGMLANMSFEHPQIKTTNRDGKWEVGDGERQIRFNDGREPSDYFLIKRGIRFAFQTKEGLSNDDGSPVLLMRNDGLSRKASYPLILTFNAEDQVLVTGGGADAEMKGSWMWSGSTVVITAKMTSEANSAGREQELETYKYFLQWDESVTKELLLEKMVVMRPFRTKDGSKRQSWMSSLSFKDKPRLVATNSI